MCSDESSLLPLHELEADDGPASPQPEFSFGTPSAVKGNIPLTSLAGLDKVYHPSPSQAKNGGLNLLQKIDQHDPHAKARNNFDVHYPFVDHSEWQLAHWLASAPLPQSAINSFLKLDYVSFSVIIQPYLIYCIRYENTCRPSLPHKTYETVSSAFLMFRGGHTRLLSCLVFRPKIP